MISRSALLATLLGPLWLALPAAGQESFGVNRQTTADSPRAKDSLSLYVYRLEHQKAADALPLVQPLLSSRGSVELRPAENTLAVRDSLAALTRVIPVLRRFDHLPRSIEMEVMVVEAHRNAFSPAVQVEDLPETLLQYFQKLLPYSTYRVVARTSARPTEGQDAVYELGGGYGASFRLGTMIGDTAVRLHDFRMARRNGQGSKQLVRTTLSLRLGQPFALALTKSEASQTALMVVLTPKSFTDARGR